MLSADATEVKVLPTVQEEIEHLQKYYDRGDVIAAAIWGVDDVLERAKEREINVTEEQARNILELIHRRQDATLGITWDTIDCYLEESYEL